MFGWVAKIPISNTFSELVEMGFVEYGDYSAFLHIQDAFSRFSVSAFPGEEEKGEQTAEMGRGAAISHWLAAFWAPDFFS